MTNDEELLRSWVEAEMQDSHDEEIEMEIDDLKIPEALKALKDLKQGPTMQRLVYFRELLRLQGELVKLQDWVQHTGYRLVVLFEGR
ncbi:MAG: polyphosphate kinase 2, partial [Pseudomonadota bacterium]